MKNLLDIYELIDISLSSEEEGEIKRASTPLRKNDQVNPKVIFEISHSSVEATADKEKRFEVSSESPESECNKQKLSEFYISFETVESGQYPCPQRTEGIVDSLESPDESQISGIFVVEKHAAQQKSVHQVAGY